MGFWIFISVVIFATIYQETAQQTARAKLLQAALEKGKDLDPQLLERLFPGEYPGAGKNAKPTDPRSVRIAAVVVASIGLGFGVLALALRQIHIDQFWISLGLGGLLLAVSGGIFVASRMMAARLEADSSSLQSQA